MAMPESMRRLGSHDASVGTTQLPAIARAPLLAALLVSCNALSGCGLGTDLRRAVVANRYLAQGNARLAHGDLGAARWCFDRARGLRPDDPQFARMLVTRYVIAGAPREAAQIVVAGLASKVDAHLRDRATACLEGDERSETRLMRAVLADGPRDAELLMRCGTVLFLSKDQRTRSKAMVLLDRAVDLAPDDAIVLNNVGYVYADAGIRLNEALAMVRRADMLSPDRDYILDSVGWAYFRRGMVREALPHLQRAAKMAPDSAEIQYHIGKLYRRLGRRREAQRHLKAAVRLDPTLAPAQIELDLCLELPNPVLG